MTRHEGAESLEMFMEIMQAATFVLGCLTTVLSGCLCAYFARSDKPIGRSVALMLCGETISGAVTVVFSGNSLANTWLGTDAHLWNSISPEAAIVMRWIMFMAMGASSIHLTLAVRKIVRDGPSS